MLRGFYAAASGMITQQRQQEALANNIANVNTPGYKADQVAIRAFPEMLMQKIDSQKTPTTSPTNIPQRSLVGSLNTGVYVQEYIPNFSVGALKQTFLPTDLAIDQQHVPDENGSLFFTVQNEAGDIRLTRNGNFTIDGDGMLVTTEGHYVLDVNGAPINTNDHHFTVLSNGTLQIGEENVQLGLSYVENTNDLEKEGHELYVGEAAAAIPAEVIYTVRQGYLEGSNVDSGLTMTQMMEAYRLFETNQRVLRTYDESLEKAVNDIGRLG
ncbi:MAG TPA: flagellar hook-basal body protein [Bacillota bacterium]|nr:flagellar hook-basal body protein [Bacillota bacterium]